jgi:hypothetical protein
VQILHRLIAGSLAFRALPLVRWMQFDGSG